MKAIPTVLHRLADMLEKGSCENQDWDEIKASVNATLGRTADEEQMIKMMNEVTDCKAMLAMVYRKIEELEKGADADTESANVVELKPARR